MAIHGAPGTCDGRGDAPGISPPPRPDGMLLEIAARLLRPLPHMFRQLIARLMGSTADPGGSGVYEVRDFRVVVENSRADIATHDVLARLDEALALIERYQPWRFRHLQRDIVEFWVVRYPCRGAYLPDERRCMTELTFLARRDITAAPVASSILHEGIHARVDQMGVRREGRDRAREERLCRRAELDFGRALPTELGEPVVLRALQSLELADADVAPAVDWGEAMARVDRVDRAAEQAQQRDLKDAGS